MTSALLVTILASPYLYNYDFILLLIPFAVLMSSTNNLYRIVVILCYLIPTIAIILYGRDGNISLILATLVMAVLLYLHMLHELRTRKPIIDFTASAA